MPHVEAEMNKTDKVTKSLIPTLCCKLQYHESCYLEECRILVFKMVFFFFSFLMDTEQ